MFHDISLGYLVDHLLEIVVNGFLLFFYVRPSDIEVYLRHVIGVNKNGIVVGLCYKLLTYEVILRQPSSIRSLQKCSTYCGILFHLNNCSCYLRREKKQNIFVALNVNVEVNVVRLTSVKHVVHSVVSCCCCCLKF